VSAVSRRIRTESYVCSRDDNRLAGAGKPLKL